MSRWGLRKQIDPSAKPVEATEVRYIRTCFVAGYDGERGEHPVVECVEAPWSGASVRLLMLHELQQPNRRKPSAKRKNDVSLWPPWAVNLTNGDRCLLATGLEPPVAGLPLTFRCRNGVTFGLPDRGHKLWTIYYKGAQDTGSVTVSIATAWY